ncbi:MAG: hypothetical protein KJN63_06775 [Acidimicrobiia bacterium]|nr:hypothetical protein [Acidimicrobiia bacterium]
MRFDVACIGDTWRDSTANWAANESDFRGTPFSVEGWIYPQGRIPVPGDGFIPTRDQSIGRWFCRGNVLMYADRPEPHVQTTQQFVFGPITTDELFATDNFTTSGIEGTATTQTTRRAIVGGTGAYMGATGEQLQTANGVNTSAFSDGAGLAPNFFVQFDMLLPDI